MRPALTTGGGPPLRQQDCAFVDYLRERVAAYPDLTAVRLMREIRERGCEGAYTAVKRFVVAIRPEDQVRHALEVRFETPAGYHAQVDFAVHRRVHPRARGYAVMHQDLQKLLRISRQNQGQGRATFSPYPLGLFLARSFRNRNDLNDQLQDRLDHRRQCPPSDLVSIGGTCYIVPVRTRRLLRFTSLPIGSASWMKAHWSPAIPVSKDAGDNRTDHAHRQDRVAKRRERQPGPFSLCSILSILLLRSSSLAPRFPTTPSPVCPRLLCAIGLTGSVRNAHWIGMFLQEGRNSFKTLFEILVISICVAKCQPYCMGFDCSSDDEWIGGLTRSPRDRA